MGFPQTATAPAPRGGTAQTHLVQRVDYLPSLTPPRIPPKYKNTQTQNKTQQILNTQTPRTTQPVGSQKAASAPVRPGGRVPSPGRRPPAGPRCRCSGAPRCCWTPRAPAGRSPRAPGQGPPCSVRCLPRNQRPGRRFLGRQRYKGCSPALACVYSIQRQPDEAERQTALSLRSGRLPNLMARGGRGRGLGRGLGLGRFQSRLRPALI